VFAVEGYSDLYNFSAEELKTQSSVVSKRKLTGKISGSNRIYEFIFVPNDGFLNSNLPLMSNCELKLSFDRINAEVGMLKSANNGITVNTSCIGSPLTIKDCVAITEYVSSDELQRYFMKIDHSPIPYSYEECDITLKNLPVDALNIRLDNIKGGNTPLCLFAGIIPSASLVGDENTSSTSFQWSNVSEISVTINGNAVNGYPMEMKHGSSVYPYQRFMDVTSRYMNPICGESLKLAQFSNNWIYAHKFEAEASPQGWLGINIKLTEAYSAPHTLVIWCINECCITIDKFHQVEKINL